MFACSRNEGIDADVDDIVILERDIKPGSVVVVAVDAVVTDGLLMEKNETPDIFPAQKNEEEGAMVDVSGSHNVDAAASVTAALRAVDRGALGNAQRSGRLGCCDIASLVAAAMYTPDDAAEMTTLALPVAADALVQPVYPQTTRWPATVVASMLVPAPYRRPTDSVR